MSAVRVGIVGAGSWGTALAAHTVRAGHAVRLWAREREVVEGIRRTRRNPFFLSDLELPDGLEVTGDAAVAVAGAALVIVAVPSEYVGRTLAVAGELAPETVAVSAAKGFDPDRHVRMSVLLAERWPGAAVAALSGPTFAREVALGLPTACVVASANARAAERVRSVLGTREFRLYTSEDVVGVEVGGALKNVLAVATGLADGLGLGENARAALVTRGLAELTRLAVSLGAESATLAGLAGLGDLVLTATGSLSRNRQLGISLARGERLEEVEARTRMVAEGARSVRSALVLAERHGVELPIAAEVGAVLFAGKPARDALRALLERPAGPERG